MIPDVLQHLFASKKSYAKFLARLYAAGMLTWVGIGKKQVSGALGFFFVKKKDGSQRIIFDTRILNEKFKKPPKTALPSAAAFSNLEVVDSEDNVEDLNIACADVRNAFYTLEVPEGLSQEFTFPPIRHKHLIEAGLKLQSDDIYEYFPLVLRCCRWDGDGRFIYVNRLYFMLLHQLCLNSGPFLIARLV